MRLAVQTQNLSHLVGKPRKSNVETIPQPSPMNTQLFLLGFWLATTPDPWRCIAPDVARIVQADCDQVALKEPAQIIAPAIEAELHTTPVDGGFHLGRATEGEGDVGAASVFFGSHFQKWLMRVPTITVPTIQRIISNLASLISVRTFSISACNSRRIFSISVCNSRRTFSISVCNSRRIFSISVRSLSKWLSNHERSRSSKVSRMASACLSGKPASFNLFNASITVTT